MSEESKNNVSKQIKETYLPQYEKQQYQTLIRIYAIAATAIAVIVGSGIYFFGGSIGEAKDNLTKDVNEIKQDIKSMKSEALYLMDESNKDAERQRERMARNIDSYLSLTKDITALQIGAIREDAKNLALSSARARIEEAFKANDIQKQIEMAAKGEVEEQINILINNATRDFPILTSAADRLRAVEIGGLRELDSLINFSHNETTIMSAKELLIRKGIDYDESIKFNGPGILEEYLIKGSHLLDSTFINADSVFKKKDLLQTILKEDNLYAIAYAFKLLRDMGIPIKTFDLAEARRLLAQMK
jgi:hypothetical protein